eukprot:771945-Pleurochrysis_carterae.AAC.1
MHTCRFCACVACAPGARSLSALWVSSLRAHGRRRRPPCALTGDRPGAPSPRVCTRSRTEHAWLRRAWFKRVGFDDRLEPRTTLERLFRELFGGAAETGEVRRTDTPAGLYRLFPVSNGRSSWTTKALRRSIRPSGASTRRRRGSGRRLSDRSLEPAVRYSQRFNPSSLVFQ